MHHNKSLAIFHDASARILLQERGNLSTTGATWGFFGGGMEIDELPEQALVREIGEELRYVLQEYFLFKTYEHEYPKYGRSVTAHIFLAPLPKNYEQVFVLKEGGEMRLFSIPEARKLQLNSLDLRILDDLERYFEKKRED